MAKVVEPTPGPTSGADGGGKPHQSQRFSFPKRSYGKKNVVWRSFNPNWFDLYNRLDYDEAEDVVYWNVCKRALREKKTVYTTTAVLSEKRKRMHSSGLQHTCYHEYYYQVLSRQCG